MKMKTTKIIFLFICIKSVLLEKPFNLLGIPNYNQNQMNNLNSQSKNTENDFNINLNNTPNIENIQDLEKFLRRGNFDEIQGLNIISKFLIADNYLLKKNGVVFDLTGNDGLESTDIIYPVESNDRLVQRARSAAKLYVIIIFIEINFEKLYF